jgi:hypothetical protein
LHLADMLVTGSSLLLLMLLLALLRRLTKLLTCQLLLRSCRPQ